MKRKTEPEPEIVRGRLVLERWPDGSPSVLGGLIEDEDAPEPEPVVGGPLALDELVYYQGDRYQVVRMTPCAAYLRRYIPPSVEVIAGTVYEIGGGVEGPECQVSTHAHLMRAPAGPLDKDGW